MATQALIKGQESATKLKSILQEMPPSADRGTNSTIELLIEEVLGSFSGALAAVNSGGAPETPLDQANTPCSEQGSDSSSKKRTKVQSGRRNGYRRRAHPYSCTKVLSKTMDDGYTWRKYGQKDIFSSKHPRSYFRCTHKYDQDCQATRQVQRSEDDPSMYVITYMGEHTCRDPTRSPHLLPPSSHQRPPYTISFGSVAAADNRREPPSSSPRSSTLKQESDEEVLSDPSPGSSASEFLMLPDLETFEQSAPMAPYMEAALDRCDVMSDVHSSNSCLDMGFAISFELNDIDDVFSLEQDELFQGY